jgi:hypothetical protein
MSPEPQERVGRLAALLITIGAAVVSLRRARFRRARRSSLGTTPADEPTPSGGEPRQTSDGQAPREGEVAAQVPAEAQETEAQMAHRSFKVNGPFVVVCLAIGLALIVVALGVNGARENRSWGETLYWGGLLLLVLPCTARLAGSSASRGERLTLVVLLGLALLAVEFFVDPLGFNNHDEFGHLREIYDITRTRHLLPFNPIQSEYTYFPGIELATGAFAHFSGLSVFVSWKVVLGALRVIEVLALFLLVERAARSSRAAGLAVVLYMCNPSFVYFDAHFSYESFALPLGFLLIQRASAVEGRSRRAAWVVFLVILVGLTVSHHLAAYSMVGILIVFALAERILGPRLPTYTRARAWTMAGFAGAGVLLVAAWTAFVAPATITNYLGPVLSESVSSTVGFVTGAKAAEKTLFEAQNKQTSPLLEQAVGFAAVGLLLILLAWGLWRLWRGGRLRAPLPAALALVAAVYPATLLFRLTLNGSETSNRASGYVYLGLGYVLAAGIFEFNDRRKDGEPPRRAVFPGRWRGSGILRAAAVALGVGLFMIGGIVVGTPRTERLPGPYYPAVTSRAAQDPESNAAAKWASAHLPPHQALFSDIVNRLLMSSYGGEDTVCCYVDDQLVPELFLTPTFDAKDVKLIGLDHIRLIVVDQRLTRPSLSTHLFFERSDGGPYYKPLSPQSLDKFARAPDVRELFDSGNIQIYDTSSLARGSPTGG